MKMTRPRPYADPEHATHRLMQHMQAFEPVHDGCIYMEEINVPFIYQDGGKTTEYSAGLKLSNAAG